MHQQQTINGNHNIVIQGVSQSHITVQVNGDTKIIENSFAQLLALLQELRAAQVQWVQEAIPVQGLTAELFDYLTERRAFHEHFARNMLQALVQEQVPVAENTLNRLLRNGNTWYQDADARFKASLFIASCFAWVPGKKLWALAHTASTPLSFHKKREYIQHCLETTRHLLHLLVAVMLSGLWDQGRGKPLPLTVVQATTLEEYFESGTSLNIRSLCRLVHSLLQGYVHTGPTAPWPVPIAELTPLITVWQPGRNAYDACDRMGALEQLPDPDKYTTRHCFEAEQWLVAIMEPLAFLAHYKIASIKAVHYDGMRYKPPRYLHQYAQLTGGINGLQAAVKYVPHTVATDSVLLYRQQYEDGVNLFPFIIDLNALYCEEGASLYYFNCRTGANDLEYQGFDHDATPLCVAENQEEAHTASIHQLMASPEFRRQAKLDAVYEQFLLARQELLYPKY